MSADAALANRVAKNARHLGRWARREGLAAWRVYDRDIPEFPYAVDRYGEWLHVQLFEGRRALEDDAIEAHLAALAQALEVPRERVAFKQRRRQRGLAQYEKLAARGAPFVVGERDLRFEVDLLSYLDTGLFLDHRETRARVRAEAAGKRVLNLFAYTGSFSVYAAAGGAAQTVSVDLSQTYQAWTQRNLALNGFDDAQRHRLVQADVTRWLEAACRAGERFDLVVLDPPSFSNSKRMQDSFDVQRDHVGLVEQALALLAPGGALYFSNNRQGFRLDPGLAARHACVDITAETIPPDFARRRPHQCWRIVAATGNSPASPWTKAKTRRESSRS
ncbi:MAG: class I SAM-dependent methyltransferase [Gammaproteobacteria bacterium]|nr:class I SAM-dependent methyltransferase [Gammaproteobacteria bacterium]